MTPLADGGAPATENREGTHTEDKPTKPATYKDTSDLVTHDEIEHGLDVAGGLIRAGVPVFVAKQARDASGSWDSTGGTGGTGYVFPSRWQRTPADLSTLDGFAPGDALGMVCGHGVDVVDVDPRNGGDASLSEIAAAGIMPTVIGKADTPSDGEHHLVGSLGVRSRDGVRPGVDVKAGRDGDGVGFVFIAPTVKRSKVTGEVRPYHWTVEPNLDEIDPGDESGAALADLIESTRSTTKTSTASTSSDGPAYEGMSDDERGSVDRTLAAIIRDERDLFADLATWAEGRTDERGRGWEKTTADLCRRFAALALAPWTPWTLDDARRHVFEVVPKVIADDLGLSAKFAQQARRAEPAPYPASLASSARAARFADSGPTTSTAPSQAPADDDEDNKGKRTMAQRVAETALAAYDLGVTPEGEPFAIPRTGPGIAIPLGTKGGDLRGQITARIYDENGTPVGSEALTTGLSVVIAKAKASATTTPMHLRVAEDPGRIVLDLGQPNSAACVIVTPDGWTVADRPPAGVIFRRPSTLRPLPTPTRGGSLDPLRTLLGFKEDDPRWLLCAGWLPASLRATCPRPLLLFLGAAGTGKTSRGRTLVNVLDPRPELGSSFGRNLDDDRTKAYNSYLLGYDNLTSISEAVSDQICRTVTGDNSEKRRNYSDTDVVTMSYRRTGVLTAITLPALRPDALERVVAIPLDRMPPGSRRSETDLAQAITEAHPGILGAVLDDAARMLAGLPDVIHRSDGPRMLDYWQSLTAIDPALAAAYADSADEILTTAAEEDPLVVTVRAWLRGFPLDRREGEPADEFASLDHYARTQPGGVPEWWPKNQRTMSGALTKAANTLAAVGVNFEKGKANGRRVWRFTLDEGQGR